VFHVVFLGSDLMFSSQLLGAAAQLGQKLAVSANAAGAATKLAPETTLVIIDLTLPGVDLPAIVAATRATAPAAKIVAFGPHVDEAALAAAQAAGADLVLSRGQFHKQFAAILRDAVSQA
jgi:DNA-binding NarL/FixJ family response regulator